MVSVQALVNQTPVTTWSLEGPRLRESCDPNRADSEECVRARESGANPVSDSRSGSLTLQMGKGSDPRKLSLAMVKLRLEASN